MLFSWHYIHKRGNSINVVLMALYSYT